jgi:hypothetical protein
MSTRLHVHNSRRCGECPPALQAESLPYSELVRRMSRVRQAFGLTRVLSERTIDGEARTFAEILDAEVEKIVLFFISRKGEVSRDLMELRVQQAAAASLEQMHQLLERYRQVARSLLDILVSSTVCDILSATMCHLYFPLAIFRIQCESAAEDPAQT